MSRLWKIAVAVGLVSAVGLAQIGGVWEAKLQLVPSVELVESTLTLDYQVNGAWTVSSVSVFDSSGLTDQSFTFDGVLGFLNVTGGMAFNPTDSSTVVVHYPENCLVQSESYTLVPPAYKEAWVTTSLSFAGASLSLEFHHWAYPYHMDEDDPDEYFWPCCPPQTGSYTLFAINTTFSPVSIHIRFADCCTGIAFRDVTISLDDLALCCGMTLDGELHLTKAGFDYLTTVFDIDICCGIGIEVTTKFTVDAKQVTVKPKWDGLGKACFELYSDVLTNTSSTQILGLDVYGYKIRCEFSDCSYVETMTALDVAKLEEHLDEDIFQGDEFEYFKAGFCGPGCCGGKYQLTLASYFQPSGSLFGFTRLEGELSVPLLKNFDLLLWLSVDIAGDTELGLGWRFSF